MEKIPQIGGVDPETLLVPARIVNEYAYCPRLAYIEWIEAQFVDNADTVEGRFAHRVVDNESGELVAPGEVSDAIHARSVWLSAPGEYLTARIDLVEASGGAVCPVDYKRGAVPSNPERSWEPDRLQLCAQALVLRAHGYTCTEGVLYYAASRTRVVVTFTPELEAHARDIVRSLRALSTATQAPPPLADSPKCPRCSLVGICLPDEITHLRGAAPNGETSAEALRPLRPANDDALPLYVQHHGARVGKAGEVFEVKTRDGKLTESRIIDTSHVALFGSADMTSPALAEAFARGIPVTYFSFGGWFRGIAHGMPSKHVGVRIAQFQSAADATRALSLARAFITGKIDNCRTLLMRNHEAAPADTLEALARLRTEALAAPSAESLLGYEGNAARAYFGAFTGMLKRGTDQAAQTTWTFALESRNRRPPTDPINALLSFAYSLLTKDLTIACLVAGLDPMLGFFHRPRHGRPALALDLMEEFRPLLADSTVITAINTGVITETDFVRRSPAVNLTPDGRKRFIQAYERRIDTLVTHPVFGYRISYRRVLELQARLLGRTLTGEIPAYPPFRTR